MGSVAYVCDVCTKICKSLQGLATHFRTHFYRTHSCQLCHQNPSACRHLFKSQKALSVHHTLSHSASRQYECHWCGMCFKRRGMYVNHVSRAHNMLADQDPILNLPISSLVLICSFCGRTFSDKYKAVRHEQRVHKREFAAKYAAAGSNASLEQWMCFHEPFRCNCGREYADNKKLKQHLKHNSHCSSAQAQIAQQSSMHQSHVADLDGVQDEAALSELDYCGLTADFHQL